MISGGTFRRVMSEPLQKPANAPTAERENDRQRQRKAPVLPGIAEQDGAEADHRADREIDAAGDDDEGHRQGDEPDLGHQPALVEQIVERQETVVDEAEDDQRDDEDRRQDRLVPDEPARRIRPSPSCDPRRGAAAQDVGDNGDQDQRALHGVHPIGRDIDEHQRAGDLGDQDRRQRRADHGADAAQNADTADHRRRDDGQLQVGRHRRLDDAAIRVANSSAATPAKKPWIANTITITRRGDTPQSRAASALPPVA